MSMMRVCDECGIKIPDGEGVKVDIQIVRPKALFDVLLVDGCDERHAAAALNRAAQRLAAVK